MKSGGAQDTHRTILEVSTLYYYNIVIYYYITKRIWVNIFKSHLKRIPPLTPTFFLFLPSYSKDIKDPRRREPEDNNENNRQAESTKAALGERQTGRSTPLWERKGVLYPIRLKSATDSSNSITRWQLLKWKWNLSLNGCCFRLPDG